MGIFAARVMGGGPLLMDFRRVMVQYLMGIITLARMEKSSLLDGLQLRIEQFLSAFLNIFSLGAHITLLAAGTGDLSLFDQPSLYLLLLVWGKVSKLNEEACHQEK
jgi:hypothetical protein